MPKFMGIKVNIGLPGIGNIEGSWEPDDAEKRAAWEMYVELITRISVAELRDDEGLLREALTSYYSLFNTTREILRRYGPSIAQPKGKGTMSFGYISVAILNKVLRPMLSKWHPLLRDYEESRISDQTSVAHERAWQRYSELRQEVATTRQVLTEYALVLADVAGIPSLIF